MQTEPESGQDEFVSKTQLKNEAKALQAVAKQLVALSEAKLAQLPLNDNSKNAVREFHKQHGNIAKRRHLLYIGKCLRNDDAEAAIQMLQEDNFSQLRAQAKPEVSKPDLVETLIAQGDAGIQALLERYPALDRQYLRQLLRNLSKAKTPGKKDSAHAKISLYLQQNQVQ